MHRTTFSIALFALLVMACALPVSVQETRASTKAQASAQRLIFNTPYGHQAKNRAPGFFQSTVMPQNLEAALARFEVQLINTAGGWTDRPVQNLSFDDAAQFVFDGVAPGTWDLKVVAFDYGNQPVARGEYVGILVTEGSPAEVPGLITVAPSRGGAPGSDRGTFELVLTGVPTDVTSVSLDYQNVSFDGDGTMVLTDRLAAEPAILTTNRVGSTLTIETTGAGDLTGTYLLTVEFQGSSATLTHTFRPVFTVELFENLKSSLEVNLDTSWLGTPPASQATGPSGLKARATMTGTAQFEWNRPSINSQVSHFQVALKPADTDPSSLVAGDLVTLPNLNGIRSWDSQTTLAEGKRFFVRTVQAGLRPSQWSYLDQTPAALAQPAKVGTLRFLHLFSETDDSTFFFPNQPGLTGMGPAPYNKAYADPNQLVVYPDTTGSVVTGPFNGGDKGNLQVFWSALSFTDGWNTGANAGAGRDIELAFRWQGHDDVVDWWEYNLLAAPSGTFPAAVGLQIGYYLSDNVGQWSHPAVPTGYTLFGYRVESVSDRLGEDSADYHMDTPSLTADGGNALGFVLPKPSFDPQHFDDRVGTFVGDLIPVFDDNNSDYQVEGARTRFTTYQIAPDIDVDNFSSLQVTGSGPYTLHVSGTWEDKNSPSSTQLRYSLEDWDTDNNGVVGDLSWGAWVDIPIDEGSGVHAWTLDADLGSDSFGGRIKFQAESFDDAPVTYNAIDYAPVAGYDGGVSGYFVSPTGNDGGTGSPTDPYQTLGRAVTAANGNGSNLSKVYVAAGTYNLSDPIDVTNHAVSFYGGYDTTWVQSPSTTPTILNSTRTTGTDNWIFHYNQTGWSVNPVQTIDGFVLQGGTNSNQGPVSHGGVALYGVTSMNLSRLDIRLAYAWGGGTIKGVYISPDPNAANQTYVLDSNRMTLRDVFSEAGSLVGVETAVYANDTNVLLEVRNSALLVGPSTGASTIWGIGAPLGTAGSPTNQVILRNNTIAVAIQLENANQSAVSLPYVMESRVIENNLFFSYHTGNGYALTTAAASNTYTIRNNNFYGFQAEAYTGSPVAFANLGTTYLGSVSGNLQTEVAFVDDFLGTPGTPSNLHLITGLSSLQYAGLDGAALSWGFTNDGDGSTRTGSAGTGWTIGAYEAD